MLMCVCAIITSSCKTTGEATNDKPGNAPREQFKNLFHEAISEKMIGNYDRAIVLFEQCLVLEKNNAAVHFALADLYELTGNLPKAIQSAQLAYDNDKENKWYALKLAQLYYKTGDFEKSALYFDIGITDDEQSLELKYQYAEALINSRQYAKAIVVLDEIEVEIGKYPELTIAKYEMYLILKQPEKADAEIESLLSENPSNVEYRLTLGQYYLDTDQYEKAKKIGQEMITINPEFGEGYIFLAEIAMRQNRVSDALNYFKTGFSKSDVELERKLFFINKLMSMAFDSAHPDAGLIATGLSEIFAVMYDPVLKNSELHTLYGTYLLKTGKTAEALREFKIVCELNSSDFGFWKQLLELENKIRDFQNLAVDGQKAIELFPAIPEFYLYAGIGAYQTGKFSEAEEFLFLGKDLVINNAALLADFYTHLGVMSALQKKNGEANAYFEEAKGKNPADPKPYAYKAEFMAADGKINEAEAEIAKGLSINPNSVDLLHVQGKILIQKKDYAQAVKVLQNASSKEPSNGFVLETYGDALFLNGQKEDALVIWAEAEKNGNNSELLKRKIAGKTYYEN